MSKLIHIPKIGHVEFPHNMPDEEIVKQASRLHSDARSAVVSRFMENDPAHIGMSHSERLKALSTITGLLEKYPRLADAVDRGIAQKG